MSHGDFLALLFAALGNRTPYHWQRAAFDRLVASDAPSQIKVPTGAGKTMMLPVWLAALATQAVSGAATLPRRLVHAVNRRVLIDEATRLAGGIQEALATDPTLRLMRDALVALSATGNTLAVSTLRGGLSDNGDWSLDPSTPAIILATPDMLGSRLLFRGYGLGRSRCATHAGLLSCDTLVIHDEAHLSPAFTALLRQIESLAAPGADLMGRPRLQVIEMTATLGAGSTSRPLVCDVAKDKSLTARMSAPKRLQLVDAAALPSRSSKPVSRVLDAMADAALTAKDTNLAVAMFVSSPASAETLAARLIKGGVPVDRIVILTGTMRGHERAAITSTPAYLRFEPGPARTDDGSAYFISTSAGEIGLDIDADAGQFDLTTLDRFIQRCGRINRRGLVVGGITLFHADGEELPVVLQISGKAALACLQALPTTEGTADASPVALSALCDVPGYADAIEPAPPVRLLEPAIVQMLSMTSLRLDELRCPAPDVFIHGVVEDDAQINLAWRVLPSFGSNLADWLDAWPVAPMELAKLPIDPARRLLKQRLLALPEDGEHVIAVSLDGQGMPAGDTPAFQRSGNVERWVNRLRPGATVLLSSVAGGLSEQGLPSPESHRAVPDVSGGVDDSAGLARSVVRSILVNCQLGDDANEWHSGEVTAPTLDDLLQTLAGADHDIAFHDGPRAIDATSWTGSVTMWLSRREARSPDAGDLSSMTPRDRLLSEHLDLTERAASRLAVRLKLPQDWASAQTRAAAEHDRGKAWSRWQLAIGNRDDAAPLGKSSRKHFDFKTNDGYRHELGSVVDCGAALSRLERHLVASHHGWARPGFRPNALTKRGCSDAADAVARGFADLSGSLGPWGLAYQEALLKAADVHAEVLDASLAADAALPRPGMAALLPVEPLALAQFRLPADVQNFGEYLAALGLAALVSRRGHDILLGWDSNAFTVAGIDAAGVATALQQLQGASVVADTQATAAVQQEAAYPPLLLAFAGGTNLAMNHWLDERLIGNSRWKLGAGQTTAAKTLASTLSACAELMARDDFDPGNLFAQGGGLVRADASKFRFDAATNWSARDAGFSLNESDAFKSTRPWVELLSAIGLQCYFPPPADQHPTYYTWRGLLPPMLALAAARGLLPQSQNGMKPVINPSGKMKDVFTSKPLLREGMPACPLQILVI